MYVNYTHKNYDLYLDWDGGGAYMHTSSTWRREAYA